MSKVNHDDICLLKEVSNEGNRCGVRTQWTFKFEAFMAEMSQRCCLYDAARLNAHTAFNSLYGEDN